MTTVTTRAAKGSALTATEVDANFTNLKSAVDAAAASYNPAAVAITGGTIKLDNGTPGAPSIASSANPNSGLYFPGGAIPTIVNGGALQVSWIGGGVTEIPSSGAYTFSSSSDTTAPADIFLRRDAANTLAQRNGVNAQAFNLYGTYTDASNWERVALVANFAGANPGITTQAAGTGVLRDLYLNANRTLFQTAGLNRWLMDSANGALVATSDNVTDIGYSGANRPRSIYVGTGFGATTKAGAPTISDIPAGQFMLIRDTINLTTKLYYNNAGTLQSVALA